MPNNWDSTKPMYRHPGLHHEVADVVVEARAATVRTSPAYHRSTTVAADCPTSEHTSSLDKHVNVALSL